MKRIDFLAPEDVHQAIATYQGRVLRGSSQRSELKRAFFIFLAVVIVVSSTSFPSIYATSPFTESFVNTTNINTTLTTATVDTVHSQTRLTTTDAWTNVMGFEDPDNINDVVFADASTGWAVTQTGKILKTNDAGVLWTIQYSGALPLNAVFFLNATEGWAVGGSGATGILLKYNSADSTWSAVTPGSAPTLMDIYFTTAPNGWAVGASGKIYRTTTGGSSASDWTVQTPTTTNHPTDATQTFNAVYVDPATSKGIIVGTTGAILRTTDSGSSWVSRAPANAAEVTISAANIYSLYFMNGNTGWIVGDNGAIFYTSDHGDTSFSIQSFGTVSNAGQEAEMVKYLAGLAPYDSGSSRCGHVSGSCAAATRDHGQAFNDINFTNSTNGFAVGDYGIILKTTTGGVSGGWTYQRTVTNKDLYAVAMTSTSVAYVGGATGTLLKTSDGSGGMATSWKARASGRLHTFTSVAFANATTGIMVGDGGNILTTFGGVNSWVGIESPTTGTINAATIQAGTTNAWIVSAAGRTYKTTDLIGAWGSDQTPTIATSLNDIAFASATGPTLYSVGAGGNILKTTNGLTWSGPTSPTTNALNGLYAATSSSLAIAVGASGTIVRTTDGSAWSTIAPASVAMLTVGDSVANYTLYDVAMASNNTTGWIVGSGGLILKTIDGGTNWIQKASGQTGTLRSIGVVDVDTVWVVGGTSSVVAKSANGGESWTDFSVVGGYDLYGIAVASSSNFVLVGQQTTIITTTNGGGAFSLLHVDTQKTIIDVDGSGNTVYGAGFNGQIVKSTDTGASWTSVAASLSPQTTSDFYGVAVGDATTAWAVGVGGMIYKTSDGSSWSTQASGSAQNLRDVDALSTSVAWIVGDQGTILKLTNGGTAWTVQSSGVTDDLESVSVVNADRAIAVGLNGRILTTIDGGTTWVSRNSGTTATLSGVAFVDSNTGWAVGNNGLILKTTSGGLAWAPQTSGVTTDINFIGCSDAQTCFAVMGIGSILHTINGGSTWTSVASVHAVYGIWVKDFETVVGVGGSGHWTARYTPTYPTTQKLVISTNQQTDTSLGVSTTTLTPTHTPNGQTLAYYVTNTETTNTCGTSPWVSAPSGTAVNFTAVDTKLFWCATLLSSSTSVSPRITNVSLAYTTTTLGGGKRDGGCKGSGCGDPPPDDGCTVNCAPSGPTAPTAQSPKALSTTQIQWNFVDNPPDVESRFELYEKNAQEKILKVREDKQNLTSILESNLTPNTIYANRVVQSVSSTTSSPETPMPSIATLAEVPPVLQYTTSAAGVPTVFLSRGNNPVGTQMAIHETTLNQYLQSNGVLAAQPEWKAFEEWGNAVTANGSDKPTFTRSVTLTIPVNTAYIFETKARNFDQVETAYSGPTQAAFAIEPVERVEVGAEALGMVDLIARSTASNRAFTNLDRPESGIRFELRTLANNTTVSDQWFTAPLWKATNLKPSTMYVVRSQSRNVVGSVTNWSRDTLFITSAEGTITPPIVRTPSGAQDEPSPVLFSGTALNQALVEIVVGGQTYNTPVNAVGEWSKSIVLAVAPYTASFKTVIGGLQSAAVTKLFRVGRDSKPDEDRPQPPPAPNILNPLDGALQRTAPIIVDGTAPALTSVDVQLWKMNKRTPVDAQGNWRVSFEIPNDVADGVHTIWARTYDSNNQPSVLISHRNVTLDRRPLPPIFTAPPSHSTIRSSPVQFFGKAPAGTTVELRFAGNTQYFEVDARGMWKGTIDVEDIGPVEKTAWATTIDANGRFNLPQNDAMRELTIDQTPIPPPEAPTISEPIITPPAVAFRGTAPKGTRVEVRVMSATGAQVSKKTTSTVGDNGNWASVTSLPDGDYTVEAQTINTEGVRSIDSARRSFMVDSGQQSPAAPVFTSPARDGTMLTDSQVVFKGTALRGASIEVRFAGQTIAVPVTPTNTIIGTWEAKMNIGDDIADGSVIAWAQSIVGALKSTNQKRTMILQRTPLPPPPKKDIPPPPPVDVLPPPPIKKDLPPPPPPTPVVPIPEKSVIPEGSTPSITPPPAVVAPMTRMASALASAGLDRLTINDQTVLNSPELTTFTLEGTTFFFSGHSILPSAQIVVTAHSDPVSTTSQADSNGDWTARLDVAPLEPVITHRLTIKTMVGGTETPESTVAYFTLPAKNFIIKNLPTSVAQKVIVAGAAVKKTTRVFVESVIAPTAQIAIKTAQLTHETIVNIEPEAKVTLAATLPIIAVVNPPVVASLPSVPFMIYHFFTWLFTFLGLKKRREPWGVVYDGITKEPVALAIVRLMDTQTKRIVETQVTDRQGRFGFLVKPGSYRIEANKTGYQYPSKIVSSMEDGEYQPVYHQEQFTVADDKQVVAMAVPLDPVNFAGSVHTSVFKSLWNQLHHYGRKFHLPVMVIGSLVALAVAVNVPTLTNTLMAIGYALMTILQNLLTPAVPKPWGVVYDAQALTPVALALVDIIDTKYNKLLKSRLSDYEGRFTFLPPKGTYKLNVRKSGFKFPVPEAKPQKTFNHPYHGEEIALTKDAGYIAKDIPVLVASGVNQASQVNQAPNPLPTPQPAIPNATPSPVPMTQEHEILLGKDHEANGGSVYSPSRA